MEFLLTQMLADAGVATNRLARLQQQMRLRTLSAGEFLLRQGDPAPDLYVIRTGLAKMFYLTSDGKEFVKSFLAEGAFAGSLIAQLENAESSFSITCLETVEVECVAFSAIQEIFDTDPDALRFGFRFFQAMALKKERREYAFLCLPADQRYQLFLQESASLVDRLTQADIARYLGITPVALSRIRGRLGRR